MRHGRNDDGHFTGAFEPQHILLLQKEHEQHGCVMYFFQLQTCIYTVIWNNFSIHVCFQCSLTTNLEALLENWKVCFLSRWHIFSGMKSFWNLVFRLCLRCNGSNRDSYVHLQCLNSLRNLVRHTHTPNTHVVHSR